MWIRSQDKEILLYAQCFIITEENEIYAGQDSTNFICVGKYSTKVRAVEILNRVQSFIKNNNANIIFEMP